MRAFRLLALVLFGVGLFIQAAAYASAQPAPRSELPSHCRDMGMSEHVPAGDDQEGCCEDMQMGCLVSMNCIAPLFPPAEAAHGIAVQPGGTNYSVATVAVLGACASGPEPPPPQARS